MLPCTQELNRARGIILNPRGYHPFVIMEAWDTLKSARGQHCNWDRLRSPAHLTGDTIQPTPQPNSVAAMIDKVKARTQARIRAHAATQGYPLHPNNGGAA